MWSAGAVLKNSNRCLLFCNQKQVNLLCCKHIKIATLLTLIFYYIVNLKISNANCLDETTVDTILYLSLYYLVNDLVHLPNPHINCYKRHMTSLPFYFTYLTGCMISKDLKLPWSCGACGRAATLDYENQLTLLLP